MKVSESNVRKILRYGVRLTGCLTFVGFLWMGLIQDGQVRDARHVPDVATGRIYAKRFMAANLSI